MRGLPRQHVVDHHRRDRRDQTERRRQQCLSDAGRHHREVGGVRVGNADEAVHDAPDRAEQTDKGRGRADGGKHASAARNRSARGEVRRDLRVLNNSVTLAQAHDQLREGNSPVSQLMRAAGQEIRLSANLRADGLKERIALQLERIEMAVSRKVSAADRWWGGRSRGGRGSRCRCWSRDGAGD
jgi:hypothetical protein